MSVTPLQSYMGKAVFVSSGTALADETVSGALQQLNRIQNLSWDINYPLQDEKYLDAGLEPYYPTPATVDVTVDWYHTQGRNEWYLGLAKFNASGSLVLDLENERNMYVSLENTYGVDAIDAPYGGSRMVLGFAQGVLNSYEMSAALGGIISSRATLNYLTAQIFTGASGQTTVAVDHRLGTQLTGRFTLPGPTDQYTSSTGVTTENVAAIGAQDMIMMFQSNSPFGVVFSGQEACYLQSMRFDMAIPRTTLKPLGYVYPTDRPVVWPIPVNLTTEAIVSRYQADRLRRLACTVTGQAINIVVKQPCSSTTLFGFYFTDLQVAGQSFSAGVGNVDVVSTQWRGWIKTPNDVFFNPWFNTIVRTDNSGEWGATW